MSEFDYSQNAVKPIEIIYRCSKCKNSVSSDSKFCEFCRYPFRSEQFV